MIECQICKRMLGNLNGKHLKNHGLTAQEYQERYPGHPTCEPKPVDAETRARMSASRTGKKHSPEAKAKIGAKHKGKKRTKEDIDKWRVSYREYLDEHGSPMLGKDRGEEFKKKMSAIAKARPKELVDEKVEQMLAARRGSKATPEQRENYSQGRLKYIEENPDKLPSTLFNTKPELEFEEIIKSLNIKYTRNARIRNRLYDFLLNDNVLIEIDGPYHYNFKMYGNRSMPDEERMALFEKAKNRDYYKDQIAKDHGYQLYRIKVGSNIPENWKEQLQSQGCKLF